MPVNYNNKRLIPAPLVQFEKVYNLSGDGKPIGSKFNISINGRLISYKGSPNSSGIFWDQPGEPPDENIPDESRLASILRKQEALRSLFSNHGKSLEFQSPDGSAPIKCNPRITSISFQEGIWYQDCAYTITCEADVLYINGNTLSEDPFTEYIEDASEEWSIEETDKLDIYRLTHSISAKGKVFYDSDGSVAKEAWESARDYVQKKLGLDTTRFIASGILNLDPNYYGGFDYARSENVNEINGNYSVIESWIISSGDAHEEFSITSRTDISTGRTSVSVDGLITGFDTRDNSTFDTLTKTKYEAATEKFNSVSTQLLNRAQSYVGITLNPTPLSTQVAKSPINGTIRYTYEFDNRPTNLIPNALSEIISVQENNQADIIAVIPVIGRNAGPVLQDLGTNTEKLRTINIEAVLPSVTTYNNPANGLAAKPNTDSIVSSLIPSAGQVYKTADNEDWSWNTGRYTRTVTYIYE